MDRIALHSRARYIGSTLLLSAALASSGCSQMSDMLGLSSKKAKPAKTEAGTPAPVEAAAPSTAPATQATTATAHRAGAAPTKRRAATKDGGVTASSTTPAALAITTEAAADDATPAALASRTNATTPAVAPVAVQSPVDDPRSPIYSEADADVIPARLVTTRQGGPTFRNLVADVNTMELVISKQGRVEQVKLTSPAKRMTDMLLLSGAKTWKFIPATKDGAPVRYRTHFSWEATP